jgi:hypothetical protein
VLTDEFKKQRALMVRELAERATDPFIKQRLLDLAPRYEGEQHLPRATPVDLQFRSRSSAPER